MLCFVFLFSSLYSWTAQWDQCLGKKKAMLHWQLSMLVCLDAKIIIHPMYHDNTDVEKCPIGVNWLPYRCHELIMIIKLHPYLSWAQIEMVSSIMSSDDFLCFLSLCRNEFAVNVSFKECFLNRKTFIYICQKSNKMLQKDVLHVGFLFPPLR